MHSRLLSALAAVLALTATGRATDPPAPPLTTRVFHVGDLVTPIPDFTRPGPDGKASSVDRWKKPTPAESAAQLIRLLTGTVRTDSWDRAGGAGTIAFAETGCSLTVTNTPEALAEVANLLAGMRRLQDVNVVCEVRVVKAPAGFCDRAGLKTTGEAVLTDREVRAVLEAAQGNRDASVTQFPKITSFDGQIVAVRTGEQQLFVTGIEAVRVKGEVAYLPVNKPVDLGDSLVLCGRVSADEKSVTLRAQVTRTTLAGAVDLMPVVTRVIPVFEGGARGTPIPFTQYLQAPQLDTASVEKTAVVPAGGTIVLGSWKEPGRKSGTTPAATSDVPYLNRLFQVTGPAVDHEVVVLATVRVIRDAVEVAPPPTPAALPVAPMPRAVRADDEVTGGVATHLAMAWHNRIRYLPDPTRNGAPGAGLTGQLLLFDANDQFAPAAGKLTVEMFDETPPAGAKRRLGGWTFDKDTLCKLMTTDERFGKSYTLFLPWPDHKPDFTRVRLTVRYDPEAGPPLFSSPPTVALQPTSMTGGSGRPVPTCPRVAPVLSQAGSRSDLLPEMEVVVAEAHLGAALADPPPQNCDDLLEMARARYERVLVKDPQNATALRGLTRLKLIEASNDRAAAPAAPPSPTVVPASGVREATALEPGPHSSHEVAPAEALVVRMTIAKVRPGFAQAAGLADTKAGDFEDKWVLTGRETRLLTSSLRHEKGNAILSQPTITLADRQTGFVQTGPGEPLVGGLTARMTPAFTADGKKVVLRGVVEITEPSANGGSEIRKVVVTETVPLGHTLVARGPKTETAGGEASEVLILVTVDRAPLFPAGVIGPRPVSTDGGYYRRW